MLSFLLMDFFQILVFLVILHKYPMKDRLDRYLIIIAVGGALAMLSKIIYYYFVAEYGLQNTISSTLCFSAMSHLYIREWLSKKRVAKLSILLHLLPFFLSMLVFFFHLAGLTLPVHGVLERIASVAVREIRAVSLLVYLLLDLFLCWKYRRELTRQIHWINGSILVYFLAHRLFILSLILYSKFAGSLGSLAIYLGLLSMPLLLAVVVYYKVLVGIGKKVKEFDQRIAQFLSEKTQKEGAKYAKSNSEDAKYEQIAEEIAAFMASEKPYLDMSFSMAQFAQHMQISQHELSMVLNHNLQTTFYEYINKYRIAHFMSHIHKVAQEEVTVLALAYESGFSSKSTFNKYFRQIMGMSPTEYVKNQGPQQDDLSLLAK